MKKNIKILLSIIAVLSNISLACGQNEIKPLKIGDQCPDFVFGDLLNSEHSTAKLSDFKGKLVILDFWATWCGSCLVASPKMDSLQKKFGDKIAILFVTKEPKAVVEPFISTKERLKHLNLPYIVGDTVLNKLFPHTLIPHEVWIDENGKVVQITADTAVTSENIDKVLKDPTIAITVKNDIMEENPQLPLLHGGLGTNVDLDPSLILFHSFFSRYIPGLGGTNWPVQYNNNPGVYGDIYRRNFGPFPAGYEGVIKKVMVNWPITRFYQQFFTLGGGEDPVTHTYNIEDDDATAKQDSRVLLEVKDSTPFFWPGQSRERECKDPSKTNFCYELYAPLKDSLKIRDYAIADLNRYFGSLLGITGGVEKRRVKCWVLYRIPGVDIAKSKGGTPRVQIGPNNEFMKIENTKLKVWLANLLMFVYGKRGDNPIPFVNETNYNEPMDLDLVTKLWQPVLLDKELRKYGLGLKLAERELDMIVIKDLPKDKKDNRNPWEYL